MYFKIPNEMRLIPSANFIEYLLNAWYVPDLEFRVPGSVEPGLSCTISSFWQIDSALDDGLPWWFRW